MSGYVSTDEAAVLAGVSRRQADYYARRGFVHPRTLEQTRNGSEKWRSGQDRWLRWRPVDVAAVAVVAQTIDVGDKGASTVLASLAADAVYAWHGRAPFAVVALPDVVVAAADAADVVLIADALRLEGVPCVTVVPLEMDSADG